MDRNDYYGDAEAALSLTEAEEWARRHEGECLGTYSEAIVSRVVAAGDEKSKLSFSRAYSLALAPQLIYARSNLLPALVSSRTHEQLDFQAVGSWFILSESTSHPGKDGNFACTLTRVPGGREDIFQDASLDLRTKRSLMKFLRFVASHDSPDNEEQWRSKTNAGFKTTLTRDFSLPEAAHPALQALSLTSSAPVNASMAQAVPRIATYLRSSGIFGPGFSAVLPKWGGLAEVAQVACRACAVGGGVYVLNKGIKAVEVTDDSTLSIELTGGEKVKTTWCVGSYDNLPGPAQPRPEAAETVSITRSISIVDSALTTLFRSTSEGGVTPAGAVIMQDNGAGSSPVFILAHSSDTGECPAGQSEFCTSFSDLLHESASCDLMILHLNTYLHCLNHID